MTRWGETAGETGVSGQGRRLVYDSYARLSKKPDTGEFEKIEDQWADNRKVIERYGATVGVELDDGLSAWKKTVRRPGWERLLERVKSGRSDGIVVWHTDRLFRQPKDLEKLIELADKGFRVTSAHGSRDLSDSDDRFVLRIEVAQAAKSSDDTQRRILRRNQTKRTNGIMHRAARGFGHRGMDRAAQPDEDGNRPQVSPKQVETERAAIRQATDDLLGGVPLSAIARGWNDAGLRGVTGSLWTAPAVRNVLLRPSNANLIEYENTLIEATNPEAEPIVTRETWQRARALCAGRRRGRARKAETYIGSGLLRCGECGRPMGGRSRGVDAQGRERREYHCPKQRHGCGKVNATTTHVDAELREFTIARLSDPRYAAALSAAKAHEAERVTELRSEIAECERLQEDLAGKLGRRELTLKAFNAANEPLAAALNRAQGELDELTTGRPDAPIHASYTADVAERWDTAEDQTIRRAMFAEALGDKTMVIDRSTTGRGTFDRERIRVTTP